MESVLTKLVDEFAGTPAASGRAMRGLYDSDPKAFLAAALPVLKTVSDGPGYDYLVMLLLRDRRLYDYLWDASVFSREEAIRIARHVQRLDPQHAAHLARLPGESSGSGEKAADATRQLRLLEIMEAGERGSTSLVLLLQLARHPDPRVRSKAVLLMGRANKNARWTQQQMEAEDARVRANAIEALWGLPGEETRALLWQFVGDAHNRVAGNAVTGLYRQGDLGSIPALLGMAGDASAARRATGAWAMGEVGDLRFVESLRALEADEEERVRANATRALHRIGARVEQAQTAGALRVRVTRAVRQRTGVMELSLVVASQAGKLVPNIAPTDFALWEEGSLVPTYNLSWHPRLEPAAVSFAFPRWVDSFTEYRGLCEHAVEACLGYRRRGDLWAVIRYRPDCAPPKIPKAETRPSHERLFGIEFEVQAEQTTGPRVSLQPVKWSSDPHALGAAIRSAGEGGEACASIVDAVLSLALSAGKIRAARHIILIGAPPSAADAALAAPELVEVCLGALEPAKIRLHAILPASAGPEPTGLLQEVARRTEGSVLRACAGADIPALVEAVCLSLLAHYRITWRPEGASSALPAGEAPNIRVTVCTEQGYGEAAFPHQRPTRS